jgi:hypothetical protein
MLHALSRSLNWCAALLVVSSGAVATGCTDEPAASIAEGEAHFVARFTGATTRTGRLIGWNLGRGTYYAPEQGSLHPEWRSRERVRAASRLHTVAAPGGTPPYVRFSGLQIDGVVGGDGYHFWDFARPDKTPLPTDNMAVSDYAALADDIGGELSVSELWFWNRGGSGELRPVFDRLGRDRSVRRCANSSRTRRTLRRARLRNR